MLLTSMLNFFGCKRKNEPEKTKEDAKFEQFLEQSKTVLMNSIIRKFAEMAEIGFKTIGADKFSELTKRANKIYSENKNDLRNLTM